MAYSYSVKDIIRRYEGLKADRMLWEPFFRDVRDYIRPRKQGVDSSSHISGERHTNKLFDSSNFDFIINISEDGWFGDSVGQYQHFTHSIYRAIEEGKDVIRSANNGITAHIDGNGLVIKQIESTQSGVIEITEFKKIKPTIFSKLGNKMFFYLLLIYISFVFFINKQGIK